jgi:Na+/proline symporter
LFLAVLYSRPTIAERKGDAMPIGVLFWVLMIFWFLFGLYWNRRDIAGGNYGLAGGNLVLFILLALLGWNAFGAPLK